VLNDGNQWYSDPHYSADITAGGLKLRESRIIAGLMLKSLDREFWTENIERQNVLQARSPETAIRVARLIRKRLETVKPELWAMIRDGDITVATHAIFAASLKQSRLLADFLLLVVHHEYRTYGKLLDHRLWEDYLVGCRERDPEMPLWNDSTRLRLRSSVYQMLSQAGYLENTKSLRLQGVHFAEPVLRYLAENNEEYLLRCIQVPL
jgi:hypothetical protein